ncbi:MAG TPA: hypothetical protein VNU26_15095 [Mycobacteriales bacterium]|nr:hypothetical protein [Mycobacteriales bacterium]
MPRRSRLLAVAAVVLLGVAGSAAAEVSAVETSGPATRLFLANDGADCGNGDSPFLTTQTRTTDINCGYIGGGLPFGEVFHQSGELASTRVFVTRAADGVPLVVDTARDATGVVVVRAGRQQGVELPGTGQVVAEIAMRVRVAKKYTELGSQTLEGVAVAGKSVTLPFSVDLPDSLAGQQVDAVEFDLNVRGVHLFHGFMNLNGNTFVDVPTVPAADEPTAEPAA